MSERIVNDWEKKIDNSALKSERKHNLFDIYKQAHSELSLQQSKRDQIITIYLALCSFLLPFALGEELIPMQIKGLIFIVSGVIGLLFSYITIRYREYKEVYWLCCQTLTVLQNFEDNKLNKNTVQSAFFHCLNKKGKGYLYEKNGQTKMNKWLYVRKNTLSSETFHFFIIALMCAFVFALGVFLMFDVTNYLSILVSIAIALIVWLFLVRIYFGHCIKIYSCLENKSSTTPATKDKAFNKVFSKAWFLHFYYDEPKNP